MTEVKPRKSYPGDSFSNPITVKESAAATQCGEGLMYVTENLTVELINQIAYLLRKDPSIIVGLLLLAASQVVA